MEEPVKEQPSADVSGNSERPKLQIQRYALRSATKSKEHKPDASNWSSSSESKRGRTASSVSKSLSVFDLSGKDKSGTGSAKPPRRFSIPAKASASPGPKLASNITPISEKRTRGRSATVNGHGRSEKPISDISKTSSSRMTFNLLTSASYWLNQIKLSESAANHSISLGFFKLALVAGCEPLQKMRDELKSYVCRHQLGELGEPVKELFQNYNISENTQQLQESETVSQVPEEGTRSSDDDDVHSSSSTMGTGKLEPKCLNIDSTQPTPATDSTKTESCLKSNPGSRLRKETFNTNSANSRVTSDSRNRRSVMKSEMPSKQEPSNEKGKVRKKGKKSDVKEVPVSTPQRNKENMDAPTAEEINVTEVV